MASRASGAVIPFAAPANAGGFMEFRLENGVPGTYIDTDVISGRKMAKSIAHLIVVYDGECPFCSQYVKHVRLRDVAERLEYVNARDGGPVVAEAVQKGFDLNEGMLVIMDGAYHHGADAIWMLGLLSSPVSVFNRLNARLFSSRTISRFLYPVLRFGRNTTIRLLGKPKLT